MSDIIETLLLQTGAVVRIKGKNSKGEFYHLLPTGNDFPQEYISTVEGKVIEFKIKDQNNNDVYYHYFSFEHFLEKDKVQYNFKSFGGFCTITHFENYKNFTIGFDEFINGINWFDSNFEYAKKYDVVRFERIEFEDSSKYYSSKKYSLIYDEIFDFNAPIFPPSNVLSINDTSKNLLDTDAGKFYLKNIIIANNNSYKREITKLITLISFRIDRIYREILEVVSKETLDILKSFTFEKYVNNNGTNFDNLFQIDQIIGNLLKDWGFIDVIDAKYIFENKSINYIERYYNSITAFYNSLLQANSNVYFGYDTNGNPLDFNNNPITQDGVIQPGGQLGNATQQEKDQADNDRRIVFLIKYLTTDGIGILQYDTRLKIIKESLKLKNLPSDSYSLLTQNNLLKVMASFINEADASKFLIFLLNKEDGESINFENLYYKIDDYLIELDLPTLGFTIGTKDRSRKLLVYILYKIWNISFYNSSYLPYGISANEEGLNPNSYFLSDGKSYFVNAQGESITDKSLEFEGIDIGQDVAFFQYDVDMNFYNEKIKIIRGRRNLNDPYSTNEEIKDLWYHIYQPILILGYKSIDDKENLYLPAIPRIPAFMFKYFKEYEKMYETNALINFGVQVTADVLLLYFTGGTSQLLEMRYLKYLSETGQILLKPSLYSQSSTVVKLWNIVDTVEKVSFVASTLANFATYMVNTTGNDEDKKFYEKMRLIAFLVMLGSGFGSLVAQRKAVKLADDLLYRLAQPGLTLVLNNSAKAFLISIAQTSEYFNSIIDKIDAIIIAYAPPGTIDNITPLFSAFTKEEKLGFYYDFIQMHDDAKWLKMNELVNGEAIAIKNWKKLYNLGASDRTIFEVIISTVRTNAIEKFYADTNLKNMLESIGYSKRWSVLNNLGNVDNLTFQRIKNHPESIEVFLNHTPSAQKLLGQNAEIWMRYFESRTLIRNQDWNNLSQIWGGNLESGISPQGYPNLRYIDLEDDIVNTITIANRTDDVFLINQWYSEISIEILNVVKNHYYRNEHLYFDGTKFITGRFGRNSAENNEWIDATLGFFTPEELRNFKWLIAHEYIEAKLMGKGINYRSFTNPNNRFPYDAGAHYMSPLKDAQTGKILYQDLGRVNVYIPLPNLENLSNLDEIVNRYIDFLKLN